MTRPVRVSFFPQQLKARDLSPDKVWGWFGEP